MSKVKELSKKVVLLGDPSVGKTSVAQKFVYDMFDDKYISTLGTKISKKQIVYSDILNNADVKLTMLVWDVMGQHDFSQFHEVAFTGCTGGIIVCDISRNDTIENWKYWKNSLFKSVGEVPLVIIGNKVDLALQFKSGIEMFEFQAAEFTLPSYFTSAKTGENIEEAFHLLGKTMLKKDFN